MKPLNKKNIISLQDPIIFYSWLEWMGSLISSYYLLPYYLHRRNLPSKYAMQGNWRHWLQIRAFANLLFALATKNEQLSFLLLAPGENSPSMKKTLHLQSNKRARWVPIRPKATLGLVPKRREANKMATSRSMLLWMSSKWRMRSGRRKEWGSSRIKMH